MVSYQFTCDLEGCDNKSEYTGEPGNPFTEPTWMRRQYLIEWGNIIGDDVTSLHFCSEVHADEFEATQMLEYWISLD